MALQVSIWDILIGVSAQKEELLPLIIDFQSLGDGMAKHLVVGLLLNLILLIL